MREIRAIFLVITMLASLQTAKAQQLSQYSQYLDNYFLINSAATNLQNSLQINTGFRHLWRDFSGGPKTVYLSAYAPITKPDVSQYMQSAMRLTDQIDTARLQTIVRPKSNHVVGVIIAQDDIGLFRKTTSHLTYSFHLPLTKKIQISASPKIGWVHLSLNNDLRVLEDNDQPFQSFVNNYKRQGMLDIGFGLWLYSSDFFIGYSLEQLTKNRALRTEQTNGYEFRSHHFIMTGYRYRISPRLSLVPNFLIRHVKGVPTSIDYSVRAEYGTNMWASLSYRKNNAWVMLIGLIISDQLSFSYSFDHSTNINSLNQVTAHEISLRIKALQRLHK